MDLPKFVYHPDPMKTGSVIKSDATCDCCGWEPGLMYDGPIRFATLRKPIAHLCPWCIADGSAHEKFRVVFCDEIVDQKSLPEDVVKTVMERTPGFNAWQIVKWWTHCDDAAEYIGSYGWRGIKELDSPELNECLKEPYHGLDEPSWSRLSSSLHRDRGGASAFVFRCRHCQQLGGYIDEL